MNTNINNGLIKKIRLELGLEQKELAKILEVTPATVWKWERGLRFPRLPSLRKIVEYANQNKIKISIKDFLS